ncbi:hypothetical protein AKJ16_DCAP23968 [Drosera capensis]
MLGSCRRIDTGDQARIFLRPWVPSLPSCRVRFVGGNIPLDAPVAMLRDNGEWRRNLILNSCPDDMAAKILGVPAVSSNTNSVSMEKYMEDEHSTLHEGALPTRSNVVKRGMVNENLFPVSEDAQEITLHILGECNFAQEVLSRAAFDLILVQDHLHTKNNPRFSPSPSISPLTSSASRLVFSSPPHQHHLTRCDPFTGTAASASFSCRPPPINKEITPRDPVPAKIWPIVNKSTKWSRLGCYPLWMADLTATNDGIFSDDEGGRSDRRPVGAVRIWAETEPDLGRVWLDLRILLDRLYLTRLNQDKAAEFSNLLSNIWDAC